jgi:hypothetical protein
VADTGLFGSAVPPLVPPWRRSIVLLGILGAFFALVLITFSPLLFGEPVREGTVQIVLAPGVDGDCEVQRSKEWLKRIYEPYGFHFQFTVTDEPDRPVAEPADTTIYIDEYSGLPNPGASGSDHGLRRTSIDPSHIRFDKRTLAHEFGHQRWGDVGMPEWFRWGLNWLCDIRNDSIIWWCT